MLEPYHELGGLHPVAGQHPIVVPQPPPLLLVEYGSGHPERRTVTKKAARINVMRLKIFISSPPLGFWIKFCHAIDNVMRHVPCQIILELMENRTVTNLSGGREGCQAQFPDYVVSNKKRNLQKIGCDITVFTTTIITQRRLTKVPVFVSYPHRNPS